MFCKIQELDDNIAIITTNSSDFGRLTDNTLADAPLCQKFLMARQPGYSANQQTHPDKRRPEANQEDHLLPGNTDSPSI